MGVFVFLREKVSHAPNPPFSSHQLQGQRPVRAPYVAGQVLKIRGRDLVKRPPGCEFVSKVKDCAQSFSEGFVLKNQREFSSRRSRRSLLD